jgi:hypothetical protein
LNDEGRPRKTSPSRDPKVARSSVARKLGPRQEAVLAFLARAEREGRTSVSAAEITRAIHVGYRHEPETVCRYCYSEAEGTEVAVSLIRRGLVEPTTLTVRLARPRVARPPRWMG